MKHVALERAEAQLAQTVREVRTLCAQNGALGAQVWFSRRPPRAGGGAPVDAGAH